MNAKPSLPSPAELAAILDAKRQERPDGCLLVDWAERHDTEYRPILATILLTADVAQTAGVSILHSLGIDRQRSTVSYHRNRGCRECLDYFTPYLEGHD